MDEVVHSREVIFDETTMPGIQKEVESVTKYVEFEVEGEPDDIQK